ncbi:MAG: molecular chaperone TorD family protein [Coriobacteriales bacterium]|jgi:TorA maturation chaperone TorD|nr:molecular chaperone TorD family protein [Coriobacteriales bacterium]
MNKAISKDTEIYFNVRVFLFELGHVVFGGEPNGELLSFLMSEKSTQILKVINNSTEDSAAQLMKVFADFKRQSESGKLDAIVKNLKSEYAYLILGLGSQKMSYPWESYYTNYRRMLFQESTAAVREFYRRFGYQVHEFGRIPEDHFSLECAFIAELGKQTISTFSSNEKDELLHLLRGQITFLKEHLLRWGQHYLTDLRADCRKSMYTTVAGLIMDVGNHDVLRLQALVDEREHRP